MMATDKRHAILMAGKSLILSRGFTATSIDAICAEVGITKGAFYYFFKSKVVFAEELLEHSWQPVWDTQSSLQNDAEHVGDTLNKHIDFMVNFILEDGRLMGILMQELATGHPILRDKLQNYFHKWNSILVSMIEIVKEQYHPTVSIDSNSLMTFIVMTIEGVPQIHNQLGIDAVRKGIRHLKHYLSLTLHIPPDILIDNASFL